MRNIQRGQPVRLTTSQAVDKYINSFPKGVRTTLKGVRQTIRKAMPGAEEAISYQILAFKLNGRDVVYFAAWKHHISLYPIPKGDIAFRKVLSPYVAGKGTVKFPLDKPIPFGLITRIVRFHVKEIREREGVQLKKKPRSATKRGMVHEI
jgi:uncharacterized protein YdhG (YjbR/CyaY superfamily)